MIMITELTPSQVDLLSDYRDKWLKIGLSTAPLDMDAAKTAVIKCYQLAGLEPPKLFIKAASPIEAAMMGAIIKTTSSSSVAQVGDQVRAQVYGNHDANWLGFYEYMQSEIMVSIPQIQGLIDLAKCCGWWAPYEGMVILQDRPSSIKFDDQNRLHCEDGPSILYRDGLSVHSWHGVRIPSEWIESPPTADVAIQWENLEQRRAACEIVGWNNILRQLNAVTIEKNTPDIGELVEVDIPDIGREKFLRVMCGTGREFALPVPPEMTTALEANAWTYGIDKSDYSPEIRT